MTQCVATVGQWEGQYKIQRVQRCQNSALTFIEGYPLCGTHVNLSYERPISIVATLNKQE